MTLPNEKIVIVGAGCFGTSTAYYLLKRGYTDVTILDRSSTLPALDAASNDINRIVRSSYPDKFYAQLARDAIIMWKDQKEWADSYHESGVLVLGLSGSGEDTYADAAYTNDIAMGARIEPLNTSDATATIFPPQILTASFDHKSGYLNRDGGWANAGQGLSMMISKVTTLGGKILSNKQVSRIIKKGGMTTGVECSEGSVFDAALVIIATGSWTPSAFPQLNLGNKCLATGQCIAMLTLSEEEVKAYRNCPVVLDFDSGFYIFPPNEANVVKMAMHSGGYTHTIGDISTPRTISTDPDRGLLIPKAAVQDLRTELRKIYPDLASRPFSGTRLCWYNNSPDEDWIIGHHPDDKSLILATAGSGHAYKFLPVIGRLVADLVQEKLDPALVAKFAVDRTFLRPDNSRLGAVAELELDLLCTPEDLLAV